MERQYEYRSKWTDILLPALVFGAGAFILGAKAHGNTRGLVINGLIELSPQGATTFYWVLTALSAGFVILSGFSAVFRITLRQRIALTETSLLIPRSRWSSQEVAVPFSDILDLSMSEVWKQRFLKIVYQGGKFTLTAGMLPNTNDFDEICEVLASKRQISSV